MRQLGQTERRLARLFCESDRKHVYDVLKSEFEKDGSNNQWSNFQIDFSGSRQPVSVKFNNEGGGNVGELLVLFVNLVRVLEQAGYMFLVSSNNLSSSHPIKTIGNVNGQYDNRLSISPDITNGLAAVWAKQIVTTEAFRQYVNKGFRTEEDIRYRRQEYWAWAAIVVSILLGLASISEWRPFGEEPGNEKTLRPIMTLQKQQTEILESLNKNLDKMHQHLFTPQPDSVGLFTPKKQTATD